MKRFIVTGIGFLLMTVAACDCQATATTDLINLCEGDDPPAGCDVSCSGPEAQPCTDGTYCGADGMCIAECGPFDACPGVQFCRSGHCIMPMTYDGNNVCADVSVEATRVTPRVILIIDQSSSMNQGFGGGSRWDVLKNFLLDDPDGLIADLQSSVEFGLALYSAESRDGGDGGPPIGECPRITSVLPAIDNYDAINSVYRPADVIEDTPTGDAIDAVLDQILGVPDPDEDPTIFIVATDGEPDRCEELDPQNGQAEAIAAVERAFGESIRTFMISVGEGTVSASHMQDMANAGLGMGGGGSAEYWVAGDDAGLRTALLDIVGGVLSCEVGINGTVDPAEACTGTVRLNDRELPCDDPNGWRLLDENRIELQGDACDELQNTPGVLLEASFPCDVVMII